MKDFLDLYKQTNEEIKLSDQEKQALIGNILEQDSTEESSARLPKRTKPFTLALAAACLLIILGVGISLAFPLNTVTENDDSFGMLASMEGVGENSESSARSETMQLQDSSILSVAISIPCEAPSSDEIEILIEGGDYYIRQSESDVWSKSIKLNGNSSGKHEVQLGIPVALYNQDNNSSINDRADTQLSSIHESLEGIENTTLELIDGDNRKQFSLSYKSSNVNAGETADGTIQIEVIEK